MTVDFGTVERTVISYFTRRENMESMSGFASISEAKQDRKENRLERARLQQKAARLQLAEFIQDMFQSLDNMEENEFLEVVGTLTGEGLTQSELIEKFRKYKGL
jgi:Ca2+-binding EF-hand superfamily protein